MVEKTKLWYLQNFNLFKEVEDPTLIEMAIKSHMNKARKKEVIYFPEEQSNTVYLLKEGKIKISRISPDGQSITLNLDWGDIINPYYKENYYFREIYRKTDNPDK